jgi:activator of HSP90 ATPase
MSGQKHGQRTLGKKGAEPKFGVIEQTVVVGASPTELYQAYVDPKKHAAFTGTKTTGTPKVGGKFTAGDGYISGKYVSLEPGKRIKHEWTTTEWPVGYPPSIVELTLKSKGSGTELTMVHSGVPAGQVEYYAKGWKEFYWGPLKKYFGRTSNPTNK